MLNEHSALVSNENERVEEAARDGALRVVQEDSRDALGNLRRGELTEHGVDVGCSQHAARPARVRCRAEDGALVGALVKEILDRLRVYPR